MQGIQKVAQLRARGDAHAPQRGLVQWELEIVEALAQLAGIKRCGADRAATGGRIDGMAMKVGDGVAIDELQRGVLSEELDHARAVAQEGTRAGLVKLVAQLSSQV